jgi:hypothetical protein
MVLRQILLLVVNLTLFLGGLLYYDDDSNDASLNPALNAAMLLTRYVPLASTQSRKNDYLVSSQIDQCVVWLNNYLS